MHKSRDQEYIEQIQIDKEFIGLTEYGLGFWNSIFPKECKVFFCDDKISIYTLKPKLALLKEINKKDVLGLQMDWSQKREKIEDGNSWFLRGLIGFLCFDYIGMALGILSSKDPVYIDVNVYHVKIRTTEGTFSLILDDLPKSGKAVL